MSRRDIGFRDQDSHRDARPDIGRSVRYPLHPVPPHRDRLRGDNPRSFRQRSISPLWSHRDRLRADSRGRNGHHEPSPRRRFSRSPIRGSGHHLEAGFHSLRARSPDGYRRRSLEPYPRRDSSRERRMRSPRLALRTPPPRRSPRMHMHPVSPRFSLRPLSPPRPSVRPSSPRLAMRPVSPLPSIRPLSPQVQLRSSRMRVTHSPPVRSVFDREIDRHMQDSLLGGGITGPILPLQSAASLGPAGTDVHGNPEDEPLSSSGMLVPRSILLEDGTVGTFYSLPPNPLPPLPAIVEAGLGGKLLPSFTDGLTQYSTEPTSLNYAAPDKFMPVERDYLSSQDQRLTDRAISSQKQYVSGERNLPEYSSYKRDRPLSPDQHAFDGPFQRRMSRSPLRGRDGLSYSARRDAYPLDIERAPRRINYEHKEPGLSTDNLSRGGFSSPHRHRSDDDYRKLNEKGMFGYLNHNEVLRHSREDRGVPQRYAPSGYDPARKRGLVRSPEPRDSLRFEPRDASFLRHTRTPPREPLRHDDAYSQHHLADRSELRSFLNPDQNARMSPRRRRSLTPPPLRKNVSYEEERRSWKRKFIEMGGVPSHDQRFAHTREPELKRRGTDGDWRHTEHGDRRPSGWDRHNTWPHREEELNGPDHKLKELSGSPRLSRKFSDVERRQSERILKEQSGKRNGVKSSTTQHEIHEVALDLPEDVSEFKQQVQRAFLKHAKLVNEDSEQKKMYKEQGKAGALSCIVCGRESKPFVDTHSLVMHTAQSKRKGLRVEHLGLCKALCYVMGWGYAVDPAAGKSYQNISDQEAKANKEDLIIWPPAIVLHNVSFSKNVEEDVAESAVKELLKDAGLSFERIKIAIGREGLVLMKYMAVLSCLHDAENLHEHLASSGRGREDWARVEAAKDKSADVDGAPVSEKERSEKKSTLYGYLALACDLDRVDVELARRCQIKSRKEIEEIAGDPLATAKKASD